LLANAGLAIGTVKLAGKAVEEGRLHARETIADVALAVPEALLGELVMPTKPSHAQEIGLQVAIGVVKQRIIEAIAGDASMRDPLHEALGALERMSEAGSLEDPQTGIHYVCEYGGYVDARGVPVLAP